MENPTELKYTKEHEWVKVEGDIGTIGITHHAQNLLTDIVFVELPEVGKVVEQNGNLGVVESVKSVSDVFSPITGEIIEVNKDLEAQPEFVNDSPFEKGWIVKIKISDKSQVDALMSAAEYKQFCEEN